MKTGSGAKATRWIFKGKVELDEFEKKQLQEFRQKLAADKKASIPIWWEDGEILRVLYAHQFKYDKVIKSIAAHTEWRESTLPIRFSPSIDAFLRSGVIYMFGRDQNFRPIIVIDAAKISLSNNDIKIEDVLGGMTYFFEFVLKFALLPGQIENWVIIMDLNSIGLSSLPISTLKTIMKYMSNNYRSRMFAMYVLNTPSSIFIPWSIVKGFLEESTIRKIVFSKTHVAPRLFEHALPVQVPTKFGGTAFNPIQFWPPKEIDSTYALKKPPLVSIEKYMKMYVGKELVKNIVCLNYVQKSGETSQINLIQIDLIKDSIANVICVDWQGYMSQVEYDQLQQNGYLDIDSAPTKKQKNVAEVFAAGIQNKINDEKQKQQAQQQLHQNAIIKQQQEVKSKEIHINQNDENVGVLPKDQNTTNNNNMNSIMTQSNSNSQQQNHFHSKILGVSIPLKQQQQQQQQQNSIGLLAMQEENNQPSSTEYQVNSGSTKGSDKEKEIEWNSKNGKAQVDSNKSIKGEAILAMQESSVLGIAHEKQAGAEQEVEGLIEGAQIPVENILPIAALLPTLKNNCRNGLAIMEKLNLNTGSAKRN